MLHCFHFLRVREDFSITNDMAKIVDFANSKLAFRQLECQPYFMQADEYFAQVLLPALAVDYYIINVGLSKSLALLLST